MNAIGKVMQKSELSYRLDCKGFGATHLGDGLRRGIAKPDHDDGQGRAGTPESVTAMHRNATVGADRRLGETTEIYGLIKAGRSHARHRKVPMFETLLTQRIERIGEAFLQANQNAYAALGPAAILDTLIEYQAGTTHAAQQPGHHPPDAVAVILTPRFRQQTAIAGIDMDLPDPSGGTTERCPVSAHSAIEPPASKAV